jgi:hypothetical protein
MEDWKKVSDGWKTDQQGRVQVMTIQEHFFG